MKPWKVSL